MASNDKEVSSAPGEMFCGAMDAGPNNMKQMRRFKAGSKVRFLLVMFCFLFPMILSAKASTDESAIPAQVRETSSPFKITRRSQFHCSEVDEPVIGGTASHEITVDPKMVKRCLLKKVGSRLNECKKLRIESATTDRSGVVTLDTNEEPVRFTFQQLGSDADGEPRMVLVWTWPDTDKKYLCTAFNSLR
jgi:hypothetical protein